MDIPRLRALFDYWRENPPVHVLARLWMQYEPPPAATAPEPVSHEANVQELAQIFGEPGVYQAPCRWLN